MHIKYSFNIELDSPERTLIHSELIRKKRFLYSLYSEWYTFFSETMGNIPEGNIIELGSGGGFLKEKFPQVITSDILPLPGNDLTFSALDMPFEDQELAAILMIDTFHHIPDSEKFLQEACRVLKPGGKIIMVEPANTLWGRFIYRNFHHEPFDPSGNWTIPSKGPLSGANGALPWIVFVRDREKFQELFPDFRIRHLSYHTPLRYLLSGGVSYRQLMPDFSYGLFRGIDRLLSTVSKEISMFMSVVVERVE